MRFGVKAVSKLGFGKKLTKAEGFGKKLLTKASSKSKGLIKKAQFVGDMVGDVGDVLQTSSLFIPQLRPAATSLQAAGKSVESYAREANKMRKGLKNKAVDLGTQYADLKSAVSEAVHQPSDIIESAGLFTVV